MRFIGWNLLCAVWLLVSAFVLPHSPFSLATTWISAIAVGTAAVLSIGRPATRFAITAIAVFLGVVALLAPGMSTGAAVNNAIVAALLFTLSLVSPIDAASEPHPKQAA